jgi:hypothetical protein
MLHVVGGECIHSNVCLLVLGTMPRNKQLKTGIAGHVHQFLMTACHFDYKTLMADNF